MQNFEPPPFQCGGSKGPLPQSSAPAPLAVGSPKCQWQSEKQSRGSPSSTTQLVPILHQLPNWDKLGRPVLKLPAPESPVSYEVILQDSCSWGAALWRAWIKNQAVNYPSHDGCKSARCLLTRKQHNAFFISLFLPPPNFLFFFFPPPYLIPFVYSVSYLRQGLSLPMCLCGALHKGWQL